MKKLFPISFFLLIAFIIAVGYNIKTINNNLAKFVDNSNAITITAEVSRRLGLTQSLGVIGRALMRNDLSSFASDEKFQREFYNVLFDWYAPVQWSPVLSVSKDIYWVLVKKSEDQ